MAPIGTLYGAQNHSLAKRVYAVAAYANVELSTAENFTHHTDNKKPDFKSKFPAGKIPAYEGADGFLLTEGMAIIKYVASKSTKSAQLLGKTPEEQALVDQWISFATTEIHAPAILGIRFIRGAIPYFKPLATSSHENLLNALAVVDKHLALRTFLVTERITAADILLATTLDLSFAFHLGKDERAKIPNVIRFYETVTNVPEIKAVFGEIEYIDKPVQFTPPKKEKPAAEAKPEKAKEPKAEKPKAEPKPKKKEEEEDDGDIDLVPAEEPKAKNPLDSLPKSTFNLEDWKRAYSNMDTRGPGGSIEWLYKNFDPEGFSAWRVDFKYNEELTQTFMSSNQIGGFFNRLEASRKYLFGSVGVLGKANDSVISGALIARGPEIQPVVEVAPDWESYKYERIDMNNEEQKKFLEAALAWDLEIDGKAWVDGKNFK
jgi:elongation factor 1-gamma